MITLLIGVDNILNKINWFSLHLLYVYYFMLCILVYQFELPGIWNYANYVSTFKVNPCYIL